MGTKWGDTPLSDFQIAKIAENEDGYNYYLYIHARGFKVIMREKTDGTEYKYAEKSKAWSERATEEYIEYDELV